MPVTMIKLALATTEAPLQKPIHIVSMLVVETFDFSLSAKRDVVSGIFVKQG